MLDLTAYMPDHRQELEVLLKTPPWQEVFHSGLIDEVVAERIQPGKTIDFIGTVVDQLLAFNEQKVKERIAGGCKEEDVLFREISRWPEDLKGKRPIQSFLGLNATVTCNFEPRCIYCNQPYVPSSVGLDGWKRIIGEITENNGGAGPYIYITGGEPLVLGEEIWGDDGLVRFATERGAAVNVNTNAIDMTPEIALRFIKAGLAKLHISMDTADREEQNVLFGGDRFDRVLEGIYNVQLARDLAGVTYPEIHTNCVLTNRNLDAFPDLFSFILTKRKRITDRKHPLFSDLFPHVIPVGGSSNDGLRPSEAEFRRFYDEVWPEVCRRWDEYQDMLGVSAKERGVLFGYFSNPFLRVAHKGGLDAYVKTSAEGRYGALALPDYCYVAPTQASFTPDGYQFRCGSHAIRRILPTGHVNEGGVFDNIRNGIAALDHLPQAESCYGCALATLYINQAVETKLKERVKKMVGCADG